MMTRKKIQTALTLHLYKVRSSTRRRNTSLAKGSDAQRSACPAFCKSHLEYQERLWSITMDLFLLDFSWPLRKKDASGIEKAVWRSWCCAGRENPATASQKFPQVPMISFRSSQGRLGIHGNRNSGYVRMKQRTHSGESMREFKLPVRI